MDIIQELSFVLKETKDNEYNVNFLPTNMMKIDRETNEIIDYYKNINKEEQNRLCTFITVDLAWVLLCFAIRMATYSLRLSSQKYFTNGLYALSMTLGKLDKRELLVVLPLYYEVQKRNSWSFNEFLKQNDDFSSMLSNFICRREEDKSLECMGYILEVDENNNKVFRRSW